MPDAAQNLVHRRLEEAFAAIATLNDLIAEIASAGQAVVDAIVEGDTIYTAGNGGSAAHAMHLAEELIGRYRGDRPPRRAVCLNADPTAITCIANDYGFEAIFSRQCEALLGADDVLVVLSTSGMSPNILRALEVARERGTTTVGLLGHDGGAARALCDHPVVIPAHDSAHIQEAHQVALHLICEMVEELAMVNDQ